jgi:hypothetical protein
MSTHQKYGQYGEQFSEHTLFFKMPGRGCTLTSLPGGITFLFCEKKNKNVFL